MQKSTGWFNTSMNLHYSQTLDIEAFRILQFNTSMNLHYSQTIGTFLILAACLIPL